MRIVLTRVKKAEVYIDKILHASIDQGFLLLVGFTYGDNEEIVEKMVKKVINLRIFEDEKGKTNLSLTAVNGNILSVSQFTLYGNVKEGNRPSFVEALSPERASALYHYFNSFLRLSYPRLQTGVFGEDMEVSSINDGPFTLILDSVALFKEHK